MINGNILEGIVKFYDTFTNEWTLRLIEGFSEKYLKEETFIPQKDKKMDIQKISNNAKSNLQNAKTEKNDEFYTRLETIADELKHYKKFFKDKIVYCPCDKVFNLGRSEFVNYFITNFHTLGLKKLIVSQYNPNDFGEVQEYNIDGTKNNFFFNGFKWVYTGEFSDGEHVDESKVNTHILKGDGSFDSTECQEIMKSCDVVVTNPPFSRFRDFVNQIMKFDKNFLIIGNVNAISYKEIYPLIKNNKIWTGVSTFNDGVYFKVPDNYEYSPTYKFDKEINGEKVIRVASICWFTNIEHKKRHEPIYLKEKYDIDIYFKYDNYNAIHVEKVNMIPKDYDGVMGVPITFLDKYCPEQFEIVGFRKGYDGKDLRYTDKNGEIVYPYFRILVRRK